MTGPKPKKDIAFWIFAIAFVLVAATAFWVMFLSNWAQ
jgi:hypothetical protein